MTASAAVTELFRRVLEVSLGTGLVIAALLLLRPLLKKRYPARLLCWVWAALAAWLLASYPMPLPRQNAAVRVPEPALRVDLPVQAAPAPTASTAGPGAAYFGDIPVEAVPELEGRDWAGAEGAVVLDGWSVVAAVWLAGCGVWAALNFGPYLAFRRRVRRWSAPETDPAVLAQFRALRDELGGKPVRLLRCRGVGSPMAAGFFRPVLLLPAADYGPAALDAVFRHELSHIRRGHLWCKLLLLLCRTVHWFNPLVWLMVRRAEGDLELACDEAAVKGMDRVRRAGYGRAVLDAVEADGKLRAPLTTCFRGGKRSMLERLGALVDTGAKKRGVLVLVLAVAAVAVCAGIFSVEGKNDRVLDAGAYRMDLPEGVTWKYDGANQSLVPTVRLYRDGEEAGYAAYLPVMDLPEELVPALFYGEDLDTLPNGMSGVLGEDGDVYALVGYEVLHLSFGPALSAEEQTSMLASLRVGKVVSESAEGRMVTYFNSGSEGGYQEHGWLCLWDGGVWRGASAFTTAFLEEPVEVTGPAPWSPDGSRVAVTLRSPEMTGFNIEPTEEPTDFQVLCLEGRPLDAPFTASGWDLGYALAEEPRAEFIPITWSADGQRLQFSYAWDDAEGVRRTGTAWYWPDTLIQYRYSDWPNVGVTGVHYISGVAPAGAPRLELRQEVYRGAPGYLSGTVCNDSDRTIRFSNLQITVERWDGNRWLLTRHAWEGPQSVYYTAAPGERRDMGWKVSTSGSGPYRVGLDYTDAETGETGRMTAVFRTTDRVIRWEKRFDNCSVFLEEWDGVLKLVLEHEGKSTLLWTPAYRGDRSYFERITAEPFENIMGHDGFYLVLPLGTDTTAIHYYILDGGAPLCIGRCENTNYELDLNGDGTRELLTNFGTMGRALVYAWVDGGPRLADVTTPAAEKLGLEPEETGLRYERQDEDGSMVFTAWKNGSGEDVLGEVRVSFKELEFKTFEQHETWPVG